MRAPADPAEKKLVACIRSRLRRVPDYGRRRYSGSCVMRDEDYRGESAPAHAGTSALVQQRKSSEDAVSSTVAASARVVIRSRKRPCAATDCRARDREHPVLGGLPPILAPNTTGVARQFIRVSPQQWVVPYLHCAPAPGASLLGAPAPLGLTTNRMGNSGAAARTVSGRNLDEQDSAVSTTVVGTKGQTCRKRDPARLKRPPHYPPNFNSSRCRLPVKFGTLSRVSCFRKMH